MSNNGTNKKLRIYLAVLYVLCLIEWFWLVRHEYLWVVCALDLEKSSNIMDIWAQLTPISKYNISQREQELIYLICKGKSNKEIGDALYISLQTVKHHIHSVRLF
jgi:ATP/maltotriose-dependent transcriptional regulator MalT